MTIELLTRSRPDEPQREIWPAVRRGAQCRCPACGEGAVFHGYLGVVDACPACGEELHHHRADDLPPYIVITIVGHIIMTLVLAVEMFAAYSMMAQMIIWPSLTLALTLVLMRPVKGAVVAYQWALRMHGFGTGEEEPAAAQGWDNDNRRDAS